MTTPRSLTSRDPRSMIDYEQTGSMQHGSLTIAHYAPRTTDVEKLRASLHRRFGCDFGSTDDDLARYLERASEWIGGRRLSRLIVAGDMLKDDASRKADG